MLDEIKATDLFKDYYAQWVRIYKEGAIRDVTLAKYKMAQSWLEKLVPTLKYLHIIQELENQDIDLVMRSLANLT